MTINQRFILVLLIIRQDGKHKGYNLTEFLPPYLSIYLSSLPGNLQIHLFLCFCFISAMPSAIFALGGCRVHVLLQVLASVLNLHSILLFFRSCYVPCSVFL